MHKKILLIFERAIIICFLLTVLATYTVNIAHLIVNQSQVDSLIFYCTAKNFWQHQSLYWSLCSGHFRHVYTGDGYLLSLKNSVYHLGRHYLKNLNTPVFAIFLLPWGLVSYDLGAGIWHVLTLLANGLAIWLLYCSFFAKKNIWGYVVLLSLYLASAPAYTGTVAAEVGGLFFLAITAVWFFARNTKDIKAGILLGVILSMKYFFGLIFILFFLQKRWRLVLSALASFLFLNGLACILFGPVSFIQYYQIVSQVNWFATAWNGSLYGFLAELGSVIVLQKITMANWAKILYAILTGCMIVYQCYLCRKRFLTQASFDRVFAYTLIIIALIGPLTWLYYFPFLMMPLLLVLCVIAKQPLTMPNIFSYLGTLFLLIVPMHLGEKLLIGNQNMIYRFTYSGFFFGVLLLLLLWFDINRKRKNDAVLQIQEAEILPWILLSYPVVIFSFSAFYQNTFWN